MKIIFWGTPKYAALNLIDIINAGHNVIAVVTQPDRKRSRGKKLSPSPVKETALKFEIPVYETHSIKKDIRTIEALSNLKADVYIVVAFGQILPSEILNQPKLGCWNSHASLLPAWRGAAPIQWSIINDDVKTGVCIMAMEEGLDTGPVIEKQSTSISDNDNLEILTNRLSRISSKLLLKSLHSLKSTIGLNNRDRLKNLNAIDQEDLLGNISYARQLTKVDYLINWNTKSRILFKKIKGLYPNSYTIFNGKRIKILEVNLIDDLSISNISLNKRKAGEIVLITKKDGIFVMTNDIPILIKYGQLEGKNKIDGFSLSIQAKLEINNILGN